MNKKNMLIFIFCIFAVVMCYILFYINTDNNIGNVELSCSNDINVVSINNSLPISDKVGKVLKSNESGAKTNGFFEFSVDCNLIDNKTYNYEIYLTKDSSVNEIADSYIKIYLTDGETDKALSLYDRLSVPTFSELENSSVDSNSKVLYTGKCDSNSKKYFILRMWLSDTYTVNFNNKVFSVKVNVNSIN